MTINKPVKLPVLILFLLGISMFGCTALNTFPNAARSLDTVTLAVGSADGMSRANTTAVFIPDSAPGSQYDLTPGIRGIFRLYADKTSELYASGSDTRFITSTSGHEPWLNVIAIDLPDLQSCCVGPGVVRVTTTAAYPTIGSHINNVDINLEILPGTGAPSDLTYEFGVGATNSSDLTALESQPLAQVIPEFPSSTNWPSYGAIEIRLHAPTGAGAGIRVVPEYLGARTNVSWTTLDVDGDMKIIFVNPAGRIQYYEPRFALVLVDNQSGGAVDFSGIPVVSSITYYDLNGNVVAGPLASTYLVDLR